MRSVLALAFLFMAQSLTAQVGGGPLANSSGGGSSVSSVNGQTGAVTLATTVPVNSSSACRVGQYADNAAYHFLCAVDNPNGTIQNAWVRTSYANW